METEFEHNENATEQEKNHFVRVRVSTKLYDYFKSADVQLQERGVAANFVEFSDYVADRMNLGLISEFVEERTPIEFQLKQLLADPSERQRLEKFIEQSKLKKKKE